MTMIREGQVKSMGEVKEGSNFLKNANNAIFTVFHQYCYI